MIAEIDADYWVAPCLRSGRSPLEPTQQGGVKQLGVLKPWSPSRSYGLIARLDGAYRPTASFHSRANGHRHGVTSCLSFERPPLFRRQGRRRRRRVRRRGSDAMTVPPDVRNAAPGDARRRQGISRRRRAEGHRLRFAARRSARHLRRERRRQVDAGQDPLRRGRADARRNPPRRAAHPDRRTRASRGDTASRWSIRRPASFRR